jgi:hypothetical protein
MRARKKFGLLPVTIALGGGFLVRTKGTAKQQQRARTAHKWMGRCMEKESFFGFFNET